MKQSLKTTLYAILLLVCIVFTKNSMAQTPPDIYTSIPSGNQTQSNDTVTGTYKWYRWLGDTGVAHIGIKLNKQGINHQLAKAELYIVNSGTLVLVYRDTLVEAGDSTLNLYAGYISPITEFYISVLNATGSCTACTVNDPVITLNVENIMVGCAPVTACDMVKNGGFESKLAGGNNCGANAGTILDCWVNYENTSDVFTRGCSGNYNLGTNTYSSSPTVDSHSPNPNNTVVGLACAILPSPFTTQYSESIQSLLTTPLLTGRTYSLSFWAYNYSGDFNISNPPAHINPPSVPNWITFGATPNLISAPPQVSGITFPTNTVTPITTLANFSVTSVNSWAQYTRTFTPGTSGSNLLIGTNYSLNYPNMNAVSNNELYTFLDDVSIIDISPIGITPTQNHPNCDNNIATYTLTASGSTNSYTWSPGGVVSNSIVVTPSVNTVYTIQSTNPSGCPTIATYTVVIQPSSQGTITAAPSTAICPGASVTLTVSGTNFTPVMSVWSPSPCSPSCVTSTVTLSPTVTTTYTVHLENPNGCDRDLTQTITVLTPSNAITVSGNTIICTGGQTTTLTASGGSTYTWTPNGTVHTATIAVSPTVTTSYTVTGTYTCGGTATTVVTVSVTAPPTLTTTASPSVICSGNSTTLTASGASSFTWNPGALTGATVVVTPSVTTTYTLTGASGSCSNTKTITVTVNSTPTLTATASPTVLCSGNSSTLTASGATSYVWQPGGATTASISVTPTITTTYTITGTTGSCSNTKTVTVLVNPKPNIIITGGQHSICKGSNVIFSSSGAYTYTWSPCTTNCNTSGHLFTPTVTTTYTLTGTNTAGCVGFTTYSVTVVPIPTITVNSPTICTGNSATLTASGANSYTWSAPISSTVNPAVVSPTATTIYTVTGQNTGCNNTPTKTSTVTVIPALPGVLTISTSVGSPVIAGAGTNTLTLSSSITNTTGLTFVWNNGASTPTTTFVLTQPEIISLSVYNNTCGTSLTQSICMNYVAAACGNTYTTLNNATITNTASLGAPTATYYVTGTLTINWTTPANALENKTFLMSTGSKIEVSPTSDMTWNNLVFYSCNGMWQGIELLANSSAAPRVTLSGEATSIEDAYKGIYHVHTGNNLLPTVTLQDYVKFNKNYCDIYLDGTTSSTTVYPLTVINNRWTSESTNTSPGGNLKCSSYYSPIVKSRSYAGLLAKNAGIVTFSVNASPSDYNVVKNKDYGLFFSNTNSTVNNVSFCDAIGVAYSYSLNFAPAPTGVGIYSKNSGYLNVKPANTPTVGTTTTFTNLGYSIITNNTYTVDVQNTNHTASIQSFTTDPSWGSKPEWGGSVGIAGTGLNGVFATNAKDILRINNNTFTNNYYPVTANYTVAPNSGIIMSVASNTISTANTDGVREGVTVSSAISFTPTTDNMRVTVNTFSNVTIGVKAISVNSGLRISNNTILTTTVTSFKPYGIYLAGNNNGVIVDNNSITGSYSGTNAASYSTNNVGILCETSPGCKIKCNTITKTGHGIEYKGSNSSSGDGFFNNTLLYPIRRGLVLSNGGLMGTQGSSVGVSANQWTGSWPAVNNADPNQTLAGGPIGGTLSDAANSPLWVNNNSTELPGDNYFSTPAVFTGRYLLGTSIFTITASNYTTCPSALTSGLRMSQSNTNANEDRDNDFVKYVNTILPSANMDVTAQDKFMLKQYMFEELSRNGSSHADLVNFYNQQQNTAIDAYYDIDSLLASGNINSANAKNTGASTSNDITQTQNAYNTLYINGIQNAGDLNSLTAIADLCPSQYGTAVYQARALLQTLTYMSKMYNDSCYTEKLNARFGYTDKEETSVSGAEGVQAKLYPNPNSGTFMLAYDLKTNNEATVNIIDVTGKLVYTSTLDNLNNVVPINTNHLQSGIYFVQITNNKTLLWTDKLMISK